MHLITHHHALPCEAMTPLSSIIAREYSVYFSDNFHIVLSEYTAPTSAEEMACMNELNAMPTHRSMSHDE